MERLDERQIRASLRNCSRSERAAMTLPDLALLDWAALDHLGWRDRKAPQRAYLVHEAPSGPVGILLRVPETRVRRAAQCGLCHTVHTDGVALFVAQRGGAAGRAGSTLGTYICSDLACSAHLRAALRPTRDLPDPAPVIAERAAALRERTAAFVASVLWDERTPSPA